MPKKDRLPYELRSDAAGHIPEEEWRAMTTQEQEEYLRPFHHPRAYDGIKRKRDDSPGGIIRNEKILFSSKRR